MTLAYSLAYGRLRCRKPLMIASMTTYQPSRGSSTEAIIQESCTEVCIPGIGWDFQRVLQGSSQTRFGVKRDVPEWVYCFFCKSADFRSASGIVHASRVGALQAQLRCLLHALLLSEESKVMRVFGTFRTLTYSMQPRRLPLFGFQCLLDFTRDFWFPKS